MGFKIKWGNSLRGELTAGELGAGECFQFAREGDREFGYIVLGENDNLNLDPCYIYTFCINTSSVIRVDKTAKVKLLIITMMVELTG